ARPAPTYDMYRVVTEQRDATAVAVPREGRDAGYRLDLAATRAAAAEADLVWLCSPNNPTALPEPDGAIETLLDGIRSDAAAAGRQAAMVVLDEAYAEFVGRSLIDLRLDHPNLVVVRTASKAYALAGLRVGFATGLLHRGLVPRTFPAGHPLAHCLRLTIRDRAGNDRLVAAAREIEKAAP